MKKRKIVRVNALSFANLIKALEEGDHTMTAEQALQSALVDAESKHLADVLIIGYDADGALYVRSSRMNCAQAFFMANKASRWAESGGEL